MPKPLNLDRLKMGAQGGFIKGDIGDSKPNFGAKDTCHRLFLDHKILRAGTESGKDAAEPHGHVDRKRFGAEVKAFVKPVLHHKAGIDDLARRNNEARGPVFGGQADLGHVMDQPKPVNRRIAPLNRRDGPVNDRSRDAARRLAPAAVCRTPGPVRCGGCLDWSGRYFIPTVGCLGCQFRHGSGSDMLLWRSVGFVRKSAFSTKDQVSQGHVLPLFES